MWRWVSIWIPLATLIGIALFIVMRYVNSIKPFLQAGTKPPAPSSFETKAMTALPFLYIAAIAGYYWYRVERIRYFLNHLHIAGISFRSELKFPRLILAVLLYGLATLAIVLTLFLIVGFPLQLAFNKNSTAALIGIGAMALIAYGISSFFYTVLILHPMTRYFFDSFKTRGTPDFVAITQGPAKDKPRHGEGLADILDIGAF